MPIVVNHGIVDNSIAMNSATLIGRAAGKPDYCHVVQSW